MLKGRHAGKKAIVVKNFDDGSKKARKFPHALVAGISRSPRRVLASHSQKKVDKRVRMGAFVKYVNYQHFIPTRYAPSPPPLDTSWAPSSTCRAQ